MAYQDGEIISYKTDGCSKTKEECSIEDGHGVVVRTITNGCCSASGGEEQDEEVENEEDIQWYNYVQSTEGKFLDISSDTGIYLSKPNKTSDSQKWRLKDGKLVNKGYKGKVLGLSESGSLGLVDEDSSLVLASLVFEEGRFVDTTNSYHLAVNYEGMSYTHNIAKRQTSSTDDLTLVEMLAGYVLCPELLGWPKFKPLDKNNYNTQCWDGVQPSYRLFTKSGTVTDDFMIADSKAHLASLMRNCPYKIEKLVIVIHGFTANANVGNWPYNMAKKVLENDDTPNIAALTVDWSEGADFSLGSEVWSLLQGQFLVYKSYQ